jgi:exosortase
VDHVAPSAHLGPSLSEAQTSVRGGDAMSAFRRAGPQMFALVVAALLALLYGAILRDLVSQWWDDPNYSHGFIVPVFAAYLIWRRRAALAAAPRIGSWLGLPVLALGAAMLAIGDVGAENFTLRSSLVVMLAGLVLFHLGPAVFRLVALPLAFLFFMIPLPATIFYAVAFPLQRVAAASSAWTLDLLGVPVLVEGNIIHLSRISLGIVEACSGIRSLISLLALAVAWAWLTITARWAGVVLVLAAVPITIVANALRVVLTGLAAEWAGPAWAQGFFHGFSGWLIFLVALGGLLGVHAGLTLVSMRLGGGRP